ncbi:MAG: energy-coupling factor ABC transporter permease [Pseudomonadota bacterium]
MEIYAQIFGHDALWLSNYLFAFILLRAVWTAPWRSFWGNNQQFNAFIGLALWLTVLWLFPVGVREGLKLHPIGATLCFLIFDWQIAALMLSMILLVSLLHNGTSLLALGYIGLVMIILPIAFSRFFLKLFYRYGKTNYFSYVLWNGYSCGALSMLLASIVNGWLIMASGKYSGFTMDNVYWAYLPVIISIESVLTGAFISGFTVALPKAVAHFNQDIYFAKKPPD